MLLISILIPVYNEENSIGHLLNKIINEIRYLNYQFEIIVINDGSNDNTLEILSKYKGDISILNKKNGGKGSAVKLGIEFSKGSYVLIQDGDLEYNPSDYRKLLKLIEEKTVVIGSRTLNKKIIKNQSIAPWLFNKFLTFFYKLNLNTLITDSLSGYKIYPKSFLNNLVIETKGFETDHELLCKAINKGYKIIETEIDYIPRSKAEGKKIKAIDALIAVNTILKFK